MRPENFLLGTHEPGWLKREEVTDVPLFVSQNRFIRRRMTVPRAVGRVCLDSGGFTALKDTGGWPISAAEFASRSRVLVEQIGGVDWLAPQDWMCEDAIINGGVVNGQRFVGTHLSVTEHQRRTVANYIELRDLAPDLRFIPVLQGTTPDDYQRCADMYERAGVDLVRQPLVGLGSVCRRQATHEIAEVAAKLAARGLRLHGFGVKLLGLRRYGHLLASADSMAWSYAARRREPLEGCTHMKCNNCIRYALRWYRDAVATIGGAQ